MTGREHYRLAEELLRMAAEVGEAEEPGPYTTDMLAAAQVHATLALAAAYVHSDGEIGP